MSYTKDSNQRNPGVGRNVFDVITNDGAMISVLDCRSKRDGAKTLIFLHGWTMSRAYWSQQIDRLAGDYRVIAIDFRGHGASSDCDYGHRTDRYAQDLNTVLDTLGDIHSPWIIGWSMGASVLFSYIDLYTDERLGGIVVVDQMPKLISDDSWPFGIVGVSMDMIGKTAEAVLSDYEGFLRQFIPSIYFRDLSGAELDQYVEISLRVGAKTAATLLTDHALRDWRDVVKRLRVPVLGLSGRHYVAANSHEAIKSLAPHAKTAVFDKSGHCCFIEQADQFEKTLRDFVEAR